MVVKDRAKRKAPKPIDPLLKALAESPEDPILLALANAPIDDEPLTAEDIEAIEEGKKSMQEGTSISLSELCSRYGFRA